MAKEWKDFGRGLVEIENGIPTGKVHPHTYHEAHGHILKVTYNPDGTTAAEILQPRVHILHDPTTGDIIGMHKGFILEAELGNPKPVQGKTKDGVDAECMEVADLPSDFSIEAYKVTKAGKLVKK